MPRPDNETKWVNQAKLKKIAKILGWSLLASLGGACRISLQIVKDQPNPAVGMHEVSQGVEDRGIF